MPDISPTIQVSEIFRSIQGEGPFMGWPASFLRMAYCDLHCEWCDAWYTWDTARVDLKKEVLRLTIEEAIPQLLGNPLLVITGGEPLLARHQDRIRVLLMSLYRHVEGTFALRPGSPTKVQFETNGTHLPEAVEDTMWVPHYVISPKLSNNIADPPAKRLVQSVLEWYADRPHRCDFKFVVCDHSDFVEIENFVHRFDIQPRHVWLMPEGVSSAALDAKAPWVAAKCRERGWNYSDRLHIRLYGNVRGT